MCIAVVTGGPIFDEAADIVAGADTVYCADSGLDHLLRWGIKPDLFVGDMDSVSEEGALFLEHNKIPRKIFSSDKDMTDTDLVLSIIPPDSDVILICSLTGRIDHVLANLGMLVKYRESGLEITATDGITDIIPVIGENTIRIENIMNADDIVVSLVPFANDHVKGVTTSGLHYALNDATLEAASSYGISNYPSEDSCDIEVSVRSGRLLVTLTRRV